MSPPPPQLFWSEIFRSPPLKLGGGCYHDGTQNYLVFQPIKKYFKVITNTDYVSSWKSKVLSAETIKPPTTSDNSLTPVLNYYATKTRVKFTWKLFKPTKNFIYSWKSSKDLHCL